MASTEHDPAATLLRLPREQTQWLMGLARQAKGWLALAIAAPVLSGLLLLLQAWILAGVLDKAIVQGLSKETLLLDIGLIAGLIALRTFLTWQGERAGTKASEKIKYLVRQALYAQMLDAGPQWTRQQASGSLASVLLEQVEAFDGFFAHYLPAMIAGVFLPVVFALVVLPIDWVAGLLLLMTAPLIPVFMALVGWGAEAASRRHLAAFARLSGFFADRVRGLSTFKLYGQAEVEAQRVYQASDSLREKTMSVLRIAFLSSATLEFFAALGVAGTALYIGLTYLGFVNLRGEDILTLQAGMFCLLMAPEVYNPLRQFAAHYHDRAEARAAVAEMSELFGALPVVGEGARTWLEEGVNTQAKSVNQQGASVKETVKSINHQGVFVKETVKSVNQKGAPIKETTDATSRRDNQGVNVLASTCVVQQSPVAGLRVENLTIRAPGNGPKLLRDISFELKLGQVVVLMGESGSGKTSLVETLAGMRPIGGQHDSARVYLANRDIQSWAETDLREELILIGQHPYVYTGSIADNLRMAVAEASDEALQEAASLACMDEFLAELPDGLSTRLGSRGYGLSGGQLQRIALARLFLRDPRVILLDEPTASLDPATRDRVLDALINFARDRAVLIVSHDPMVAQRADVVWRIHEGTIANIDKPSLQQEGASAESASEVEEGRRKKSAVAVTSSEREDTLIASQDLNKATHLPEESVRESFGVADQGPRRVSKSPEEPER